MTDIKAYLGDDPYIFVSYARKNKDIVYPFIAELQERYNVWIDKSSIPYGADFDEEISSKIENCALFMFFITEDSLGSPYCMNEIRFANECKKTIVNILTKEDIDLPGRFRFKYGGYQMFPLYEHASLSEAIADIESKCKAFKLVKHRALSARAEEALPPKVAALAKEAESGDAEAQCRLGFIYDQGNGVPQSYEKAAALYQKAAEQGHAEAQFRLGYFYKYGQGVQKSDEKAAELFQRSAEQGDRLGQAFLGKCYDDGEGVPQSYESAVFWYRRSAEQKYVWAQFILGWHYLVGRGVEQSDEQAVFWYREAAAQEYKPAIDALKKMGKS